MSAVRRGCAGLRIAPAPDMRVRAIGLAGIVVLPSLRQEYSDPFGAAPIDRVRHLVEGLFGGVINVDALAPNADGVFGAER